MCLEAETVFHDVLVPSLATVLENIETSQQLRSIFDVPAVVKEMDEVVDTPVLEGTEGQGQLTQVVEEHAE